jgi:hypothetical protein
MNEVLYLEALAGRDRMVITSAIFLNKIDSGMHKVTQNLVGEGEMLYRCQEKKVLEHSSGTSF